MVFPLSYLEGITKNINEENKKSAFDESMIIELSDGSLVTLGELMKFWVTGHQVISEAKEITDEMLKQNKEVKDIERSTKKEKKLQSKQKVERLSSQEKCGTERTRPDNTKEDLQGSDTTSSQPKRRRVRKSE